MAFIPTVDEHEAEGAMADAYAAWRSKAGLVSNVAKAFSIRPEVLPIYLALSKTVTGGGSSLGRRKEELIAVVSSAALSCKFCTLAHGENLRKELGGSHALTLRVRYDFRTAGLPDDEVAMLAYAETLTLAPSQVGEHHIEALRQVGFSDRQIFDIALVTSYRNFISRMVDGLGVEIHPRHDELDQEFRDALTTF